MRLVLICQARAVERDPLAYPDDRARPLCTRGRREHSVMAEALARMELGITHLLSSPVARARETAEITAEALGFPTGGIGYCEELSDRGAAPALLARLRQLPTGATVALVGHEPNLSVFAAEMLHPDSAVLIDLKKSGILGLDFEGHPEPGRGELKFMLTPRTILPLMEGAR